MNAQTKIYWLVVQSIRSLQKMRFIIQVRQLRLYLELLERKEKGKEKEESKNFFSPAVWFCKEKERRVRKKIILSP